MGTVAADTQIASAGESSDEIHSAALALAEPKAGLSWLDIGCGTGEVLRAVRNAYSPKSLVGVDVIDWLADDLRNDVQMDVGQAEQIELEPADRVLMVEVIEHLDAPWSVLRAAVEAVAPGGRIVVTTPSVTNLRHRGELLLRGRLTSFRPDNRPHFGPALPHVIERVMAAGGLKTAVCFCARDIIPNTGGRLWPKWIHARAPEMTSLSVAVVGTASPSQAVT